MAFRELEVVEIREILRRWMTGIGYRRVGEQVGVDRKTVRRYAEAAVALGLQRYGGSEQLDDELVGRVAAAVQPGAPSKPGETRELCREHEALIRGWLDDGVPAAKIVKLLGRVTRVAVPLRTLQRFASEELGHGRSVRSTVRIADCEPGEEAQFDFTDIGWLTDEEGRRKLQALVVTAVYSRHMFVWPCLDQEIETVIEGLDAAWAFFGGVFRVLIPDNVKAIVVEASALNPRICPSFLEYAQARGFLVDPARVRHPKDKPRVERSNHYVQGNFAAGEHWRSLEEARVAAVGWCRQDAGMRIHGTTFSRPLEVFELEEKPRLLPAPTEPYDVPQWLDVKIGRDHVITVAHSLYSVPHGIEPQKVRVRLDRCTVKVYLANQLLKAHPRVEPGKSRIDPNDLPEEVRALATRDTSQVLEQAAGQGRQIGEFARRILDGPLPWTRMRHLHKLLRLVDRYGAATVERACEQALQLDVVDVQRIERMLAQALEQRQAAASVPASTQRPVALRFARAPEEFAVRRFAARSSFPPATEGGPDAQS